MQPAQIAKELGVRYILEGSTRRVGDDMRINAQLIDAQTGGHLWAERFDGHGPTSSRCRTRSLQGRQRAQAPAGSKPGRGGAAAPTIPPPTTPICAAGISENATRPRTSPRPRTISSRPWRSTPISAPRPPPSPGSIGMPTESGEGAGPFVGKRPTPNFSNHLEEAAKHPSTDYYAARRVAGTAAEIRRGDRSAAKGHRARSQRSWIFDMSQALISTAGRGWPGLSRCGAACRSGLDDPWRYYLRGSPIFRGPFRGCRHFARKDRPPVRPLLGQFYGLQVLLSAYGHLGRGADGAAMKEKLKPLLTEINVGQEFTGLLMRISSFKNFADFERLLDGLRKAGVPEPPSVSMPNRRTGSPGRRSRRPFGHELRGANATRMRATGGKPPRWNGAPQVGRGPTLASCHIEGTFIASTGGWNKALQHGVPQSRRNTRKQERIPSDRRTTSPIEFSVVK